jgi:hypothetical protein
MRQHSPTAWRIASLYSHVLASETRDLAAHIDSAIARERERCAQVAVSFGDFPGSRLIKEMREMCGNAIADKIRETADPVSTPLNPGEAK